MYEMKYCDGGVKGLGINYGDWEVFCFVLDPLNLPPSYCKAGFIGTDLQFFGNEHFKKDIEALTDRRMLPVKLDDFGRDRAKIYSYPSYLA
jgi:hypothetical protein